MDALRELAQLLDRDLELVGGRREQPLDLRVAARRRAAAGRCGARARARRAAAARRRGGRARFAAAPRPAAVTMRARDSCTVSSCARTSACSRALTSASRAAAATASTSFGSSRSVGSWTRTASGSPSCSISVTARVGPSSGTASTAPAASTYSPRSGSQRPSSSVRIVERERELVPEVPGDRRLLEVDDELADVHAREPRAEQPAEERERQRGQRDDLPPEEVVREARAEPTANVRMPSSTARRAATTAARRSGAEDPAGARRRRHELPGDEHDEERREHAVGRDARMRPAGAPTTSASPRDERAGSPAGTGRSSGAARVAVVEEQDRERERDRDGVRDREKRRSRRSVTRPDGYASATCAYERVAELADEEEDGERERRRGCSGTGARGARSRRATISGPSRLSGRRDQATRPATRNDQAATTVAIARAGRRERLGQVVDLNLVGEDAEDARRRCPRERSAAPASFDIVRIVTRSPAPSPRGRPWRARPGKPRDESQARPVTARAAHRAAAMAA